jgi:hypothetical protein
MSSCAERIIEALMPDGKARKGTSHDLGQNFFQKKDVHFNISFQNAHSEPDYAW